MAVGVRGAWDFVVRAAFRHASLASRIFLFCAAPVCAAPAFWPPTFESRVELQRGLGVNPLCDQGPCPGELGQIVDMLSNPESFVELAHDTHLVDAVDAARPPVLRLAYSLVRRAFGSTDRRVRARELAREVERKFHLHLSETTLTVVFQWPDAVQARALADTVESAIWAGDYSLELGDLHEAIARLELRKQMGAEHPEELSRQIDDLKAEIAANLASLPRRFAAVGPVTVEPLPRMPGVILWLVAGLILSAAVALGAAVRKEILDSRRPDPADRD